MSFVVFEKDGRRERVAVAATPQGVWVGWSGAAALIRSDRERKGTTSSNDEIRAPMTGKILEVNTSPGAKVGKDDVLAVMEAMKMEYKLTAPRDGVVDKLGVKAGDQVDLGQSIVLLAAEEA